jgi:hypothetical protein
MLFMPACRHSLGEPFEVTAPPPIAPRTQLQLRLLFYIVQELAKARWKYSEKLDPDPH